MQSCHPDVGPAMGCPHGGQSITRTKVGSMCSGIFCSAWIMHQIPVVWGSFHHLDPSCDLLGKLEVSTGIIPSGSSAVSG